MSVVLAFEPDGTKVDELGEIVRMHFGAELTFVTSAYAAITAINQRTPDLVLIGAASSFPHGSVQPTRLEEGTIVLFDGGCNVAGYKSDISRTFVIGKPSGMAVHGGSGVSFGVIEALRASRPGETLELAHRLDQPHVPAAAGWRPARSPSPR